MPFVVAFPIPMMANLGSPDVMELHLLDAWSHLREMRFLILLAVVAACSLQVSHAFKIAAFNIERFDAHKVDDPVVLNLLIRILRRYELIAVQEVMNANDTAIKRLVEELNVATGLPYNLLISDHLGRGSYREKYVYIFREDILKPTEWYHYDDGCENCGSDSFLREPFVVRFSSLTTGLKDFVLATIHTSPDYAVLEVNALYDVWEDAKQRLHTENIMILGDFNADCSYVTARHWPMIRLRQDERLQWFIEDGGDTTVSTNNNCAYDRFVVSGAEFLNALIPETAKPINLQKEYGLTYAEAKAVSDHYPIEIELRKDELYNGQLFGVDSSFGISGGLSLNGVCDCAGVDFASCDGRCGAYSRTFPCSCNASCTSYSDCCTNYLAFCKP
uniref:SMB domain-containing protein n=2 Tax=Leptobrachium leishanense TaxID=445787 RepID=A0A8C5W6S7_9ANUR